MGRQAWVWVVVDGDCPPHEVVRGGKILGVSGAAGTHTSQTHSVYGPVEVRTGKSERGPQRDVEMSVSASQGRSPFYGAVDARLPGLDPVLSFSACRVVVLLLLQPGGPAFIAAP